MKKFILIALLLLACRSATMAQDVFAPYHTYQPRTTGPTRQGSIYYNGTEFRQVTSAGDNPIGTGGGVPANMMTTDTAQVASGQKTWTSEQIFNLGFQTKNNIRWDGAGTWANGTTSAYPGNTYGRLFRLDQENVIQTLDPGTGWAAIGYGADSWTRLRHGNGAGGFDGAFKAGVFGTSQTNDNSWILQTHNASDTGILVMRTAYAGGFDEGWTWRVDGNQLAEFYRNTVVGNAGLVLGSATQSMHTTFRGNPFAYGDNPIITVIDDSTSFNTTPVSIERTTGGTFSITLQGNVGSFSTRIDGGTAVQLRSTSGAYVQAGNNSAAIGSGTGAITLGSNNVQLVDMGAVNTGSAIIRSGFPGQYIGFGDNRVAALATLGRIWEQSNLAVWQAGETNPGVFQAKGIPTDNKVGALELQDDNTGGVESVFLFKREGVDGVFFHTSYPTDPDTQGTQLATGSGGMTLDTAQTVTGTKTFNIVQYFNNNIESTTNTLLLKAGTGFETHLCDDNGDVHIRIDNASGGILYFNTAPALLQVGSHPTNLGSSGRFYYLSTDSKFYGRNAAGTIYDLTKQGDMELATTQTNTGEKTFSGYSLAVSSANTGDPTAAGGKIYIYGKTDNKLYARVGTGTIYDLTPQDLSGYMTLGTAQSVTGAKTFTVKQTFNGGIYTDDVTYSSGTSAASASDYLIFVDASSNTVNLQLPVNDGQWFRIKVKDVTNAITVTPSSGNIDGASSYTGLDTQYEAIDVYCDGTNFWIF